MKYMSKYVASLKLMKSKQETKEMPYINLMPRLSMTLAYMEMYIKDTGIHYLLKKFVRWQNEKMVLRHLGLAIRNLFLSAIG